MENNNEKEKKAKEDKAKAVGAWAKAIEYSAKALGAVVGLVVFVIWEFAKSKK